MILDWNWLSKSAPTQYHLKKKIILGIRALLAGCVRANHRRGSPAVTAGRLIPWLLIKITSDKFTSACLHGWKEGFSPKSTMMNWNLSATGDCFSPSLRFISGLPSSQLCFPSLFSRLFSSLRKGRTGTAPHILIYSDPVIPEPLSRLFSPLLLEAVSHHRRTCNMVFWLFVYGRNAFH